MTELAAKVDMVTLGVMGWWWRRVRQKLGLLFDFMKQKIHPSDMIS